MRPEKLYLVDIVEAADAIGAILSGVSRGAFLESDTLRSAVLLKLINIGEAAARLPDGFRKRHADTPWPDIVAFRNIAVHEYFAVDWPIVWVAATKDAPALRERISRLLKDEYGLDRKGS